MKIKINSNENKYIDLKKHFTKQNFSVLHKTKKINGVWQKVEYINAISCYDSETSKIFVDEKGEYRGWVYQWSMCINNEFVGGRTITQFLDELDIISKLYELSKNRKLIIYIHNLSYDAVYFLRYMHERDDDTELFLLDNRKILTLKYKNFEFRDSYRLCNMSLEKWANQLHTKCKKAVGSIDYEKVHYQDDKLDYVDWFYQVNDVETMRECIELTLLHEKDTLLTIPLTSTGYVRRDCRNSVKNDKKYFDWFIKTSLTEELYSKFTLAFAGGYCHLNRHFINKLIKIGDYHNGKKIIGIGHFDKKSFYPSTQMMDYFPISKFVLYYKHKQNTEYKKVETFQHELETKCCLCLLLIENATLKKHVTSPYMQVSKLIGNSEKLLADNGRVLSFKGTYALYCTELDIEILTQQYKANFYILEMYTSKRGEFPKPFKEIINKFFIAKETLGDSEKEEDYYYYMKSKNKLNAIFGMSVSRIIRDIIEYDFYTAKYKKEKIKDKEERIKKLDKYYNSRNSFFPYQLGVYVTAHCRNVLQFLIQLIGYENFIYSDTDSIFFIITEDNIKRLEEYNKMIVEKNIEMGLGVYHNNHISYYNLFVDEKEKEGNILEFKSLHSKCYAYKTDKKGVIVTIAGVSKDNKKQGSDYVTSSEELQEVDNLTDEFTFYECGGTISKYICNDIERLNIKGHIVELADSCIILKHSKQIKDLSNDTYIFDYESEV